MSKFTDLLADQFAEKHILVVAEPRDVNAGVIRPLYFSSHGFTSRPGDSPANQHYAPRVRKAYSFTRSLFSGAGKISGRSVPGYGSIELNNPDGRLDVLGQYAWSGRRVRIWLGGRNFALSEYGLIFSGTAQGLSWSDDAITIELRDLAYLFDREFQTKTFTGAGGIEGTSDLKGRRKPRAYGICRYVQPLYIGQNSGGKHLFCLNDGPIVGVLAVYDRGVGLTFTTGTPSSGQYAVDLAAGIVILGGAFNGPIQASFIGARYFSTTSTTSVTLGGTNDKTFTVPANLPLAPGMMLRVMATSSPTSAYLDGRIVSYSGTSLVVADGGGSGSGAYANWTIAPWGTAPGVMRAFATSMGVTELNATNFQALESFFGAVAWLEIGYYSPEGGNGLEVMDALADGTGSYWGFDRAGRLDAGRIAPNIGLSGDPNIGLGDAAPSVATYGPTQILSIVRRPTDEPDWSITVRYQRTWGPLTPEQVAGVATGQTAFTEEWRQSTIISSALTDYPLAKAIVIDTLFDYASETLFNNSIAGGASAEAVRQVRVFGVRRDAYTVTLKAQPLLRNMGDTITVRHPRYGLATGKNFYIVDMIERIEGDVLSIEFGLWG